MLIRPNAFLLLICSMAVFLGLAIVQPAVAQEGDSEQSQSREQRLDRDQDTKPPTTEDVSDDDRTRGDRSRDRRAGHRWEYGDGDGRRRGGSQRLNPDQRELLIDVIRDLRPLSEEDHQRLLTMEWEKFRELINERGSFVSRLARIKQNDPALYDLKLQEFQLMQRGMKLAAKLKQAKEAENAESVAALEKEFRELVAEHVDLGYLIHEHEIAAVESRLAEMQRRLSEERAHREEEIEHRLRMLREGPMRETPPHWNRERDDRRDDRDRDEKRPDRRPF